MEIRDERTLSATCAPLPASYARANGATGWPGPGARRTGTAPAERDRPPRLTAREIAVLNGAAAGLSDREIALRLMLFEAEVRDAWRSLCRKVRVGSPKEAVAYAAARPGGV